ncbi:MAG: thiamine pyrophosphate-dependent enzyme [Candidatus Hermodarchaeota archaeon]
MTHVTFHDLEHPVDNLLRQDRLPHVWCAGCGLGSIVSCYLHAVMDSGIPQERIAVVSGIGCSGRASGYLNFDVFHTTHGRAIAFAVGLKVANPSLSVSIISGDGDIAAIGGNHLIHAARRNADLFVLCINNFLYGMTGGQSGPTTPIESLTTTTPYRNQEKPFNLVSLVASSGATYVARWTSLHVRRLTKSITEALKHPGFSFIEVISPCPTTFGRKNKYREAVTMLEYFREKAIIKHGHNPMDTNIELGDEFYVGKFVDKRLPTFLESLNQVRARALPKGV